MSNHPWEKNYPAGLAWDEPLPPAVALESFLEVAAKKWPTRVALDFYDRLITFQELHELSLRTAAGLQELGVGPGVNVGLYLPNTPHFVIGFFGTLLAGGQVVNFNPFSGSDEFERQLRDSSCKVILAADWVPRYSQLVDVLAPGQLDAVVVCSLLDFLTAAVAEGLIKRPGNRAERSRLEIDFGRLRESTTPLVRHEHGNLANEVAVLQFTGGTTGETKAAMLTHANFAAVIAISDRWAGAENRSMAKALRSVPMMQIMKLTFSMLLAKLGLGEQPTIKTLAVMPFWHIFGLISIMLGAIVHGLQLVLHLRFDATRVLKDIADKRINVFSGVPAMFAALVNHPQFDRADMSSLLACGSGGAPLPNELRARFERLTKRSVREGYGLTEATGLATFPVAPTGPCEGHRGLPAPGTLVEVVDLETGLEPLPQGEVGEICLTGAQIMKGYWHKPGENVEAFRGGRFHTGDVGFIDKDGYLVLSDRKKDMIIVGGHNVYPRNIERAIYDFPSVMEVLVIGIPNKEVGEVVKALITLSPGKAAFSLGELHSFLKHRVASYELPFELEFRESLPKTEVGKLSKNKLLQELNTGHAHPG